MRLLIIFILTLSFSTYAQTDFSLGASARSYPSIGLEVNAQTGYNMLLWGKGDKKNPLYGLVRPALTLTTSAVVNNYDARIELYPISFLAIIRGYKHINSNYDFPFYNCDLVRCKGDIKRDYTRLKMAMAYAGITVMGNIMISNNEYSNSDGQSVAEFRYVTLGAPDRDQLYYSQYVVGFKYGEGMFGVMSEYTKLAVSQQTYNMDLLIYTTNIDRSNYIFGIGQMSSSERARGFIAVFQMRTDFIPSKKLF